MRLKVFINEHGEGWTVDVDGDVDFEVETPTSLAVPEWSMHFLKIPKGAT